MKRKLIAWGPAVLWAAVLFFLSELRELPAGLGRFAELNDKFVHAVLYSTLGVTLAWARRCSAWKPPHWLLLSIGFMYGALDEWHQSFIPNRSPDVGDFFADVTGIGIGYLLFMGMWMAFFRVKPEPVFGEGSGIAVPPPGAPRARGSSKGSPDGSPVVRRLRPAAQPPRPRKRSDRAEDAPEDSVERSEGNRPRRRHGT